MSREYSLSSGGLTTVSAVVTLAFINPGTTASLEILRVWATQSGTATSAQQRVQTNTQVTAFPTLTAKTPGKLKLSDPVSLITGGTAGAAGTAGVNASAEGGGAKTTIHEDNFNILNGWLWVATPPETVIMNAGAASGFGVHLPAAPGNTAGWATGIIYREL
jgi:hypothetical protein